MKSGIVEQSLLLNRPWLHVQQGDGVFIITVVCPLCEREQDPFTVDPMAVAAYDAGALIQKALPDLTESQLEGFLTGMCDCCWDVLTEEDE